jgi:hypothetical protein
LEKEQPLRQLRAGVYRFFVNPPVLEIMPGELTVSEGEMASVEIDWSPR